jgi:hypothetical protein
MWRGRLLFRMAAAGIALCYVSAFAQQPSVHSTGRGAEGRLMVTAVVVSSVGLVVSADGEQQIVIANAPDARDNVSRLQPVVAVLLTPVANDDKRKPAKKKQP